MKKNIYTILGGIIFIIVVLVVVKGSLNSACGCGDSPNPKTIASMEEIRSEAEIFWNSKNNSYVGLCSSPQVKNLIATAEEASKNVVECNEKKDAYAVQIKLPEPHQDFFCVDSTGNAMSSSTLTKGALICNPPQKLENGSK